MTFSRSHGALPWMVAVGLVFAALGLRVGLEGRAELAAGTSAEAGSTTASAIEHYGYAMRWYLPFASAPVEAADALDRIALAAASAGDRPTELLALRRLRAGIFATRSLYTPFIERRADVDERLARVTTEEDWETNGSEGLSREDRLAAHRGYLALDHAPHAAWAMAASLGFLGFVASLFALIFRGLDAELRPRLRPALLCAASTLVCLAAWIAGMALA